MGTRLAACAAAHADPVHAARAGATRWRRDVRAHGRLSADDFGDVVSAEDVAPDVDPEPVAPDVLVLPDEPVPDDPVPALPVALLPGDAVPEADPPVPALPEVVPPMPDEPEVEPVVPDVEPAVVEGDDGDVVVLEDDEPGGDVVDGEDSWRWHAPSVSSTPAATVLTINRFMCISCERCVCCPLRFSRIGATRRLATSIASTPGGVRDRAYGSRRRRLRRARLKRGRAEHCSAIN